MRDARRIEFLDERHSGVGTRMAVVTGLGPFRIQDRIQVTDWEPPRRIGVVHTGAVAGRGEFLLIALGEGRTRLSWTEELRLPWYLGGPLAAWAVRPLLRRTWKANLERFRTRLP